MRDSIFTRMNKGSGIAKFVLAAVAIAFALDFQPTSVFAGEDIKPGVRNTPAEDAILKEFVAEGVAKRRPRVGYLSFRFGGGTLAGGDYGKFIDYNNSNIFRTDGGTDVLHPLPKSYEFGIDMGIFTSKRTAFSLGFEYWKKAGSSFDGDYFFTVEPLGQQNQFTMTSQIGVMGITSGIEYFISNPPDREGNFDGLSFAIGGTGGYYFARWDLWEGSGNINLATGAFEQILGTLKSQKPGFGGSIKINYPTQFLSTVLGLEGGYFFLNFNNLKWYNSLNEEIFATYSNDTNDRVGIDFSGIRARIQLRRYFSL